MGLLSKAASWRILLLGQHSDGRGLRDALLKSRRRIKLQLPTILKALGQRITQAIYDLLGLKHL